MDPLSLCLFHTHSHFLLSARFCLSVSLSLSMFLSLFVSVSVSSLFPTHRGESLVRALTQRLLRELAVVRQVDLLRHAQLVGDRGRERKEMIQQA